ncbi:MAG: hypothetical protein OSA79_05210 [Candidatus Thioglobus sp.]|nr:hypothetical protein [Candidatus Thioglobus sp.]
MRTSFKSTIFGVVRAGIGRVPKTRANLGPHQHYGGLPANKGNAMYSLAS